MKVSINNKPSSTEFNTKLLKPRINLYPKFWKGNSLRPIISRKLMAIADDVIKSLDFNHEVKDVIITGSIASYNWHSLSDIDLHIVLDFDKIDNNYDLVKRMLDQTRINWNKKHDIKIAGKEVEIYFQHYTEPHEANGIWSLGLERWLAKPIRLTPEIDLKTTEKKAETVAVFIDHLQDMFRKGEFESTYNFAGKIKGKIARMRRAGLDKEGVYSPENLAFKMLRNAGLLEKLSSIKILSYDRMMSYQAQQTGIDENKVWKNYLNKGEQ
jgi:hypothetical protein